MKFKDEYILAKGWPTWMVTEIGMMDKETDGKLIKLKYTAVLYNSDCPKYELVLRRLVVRKNQTQRSR